MGIVGAGGAALSCSNSAATTPTSCIFSNNQRSLSLRDQQVDATFTCSRRGAGAQQTPELHDEQLYNHHALQQHWVGHAT